MARNKEIRFWEALDWVRRIEDPTFTDWDAHCLWLEADPANAAAFDEASMVIEKATAGLAASASLSAAPQVRRRLPMWAAGGGLAIAASLVAVFAWPQQQAGPSLSSTIATAPGQSRRVALADGTHIRLNGDTRLEVDSGNVRHVRLARGQAFFTVVHDEKRPFSVAVGGDEVRDVGTAFDVKLDRNETSVAVREGAVLYQSAGEPVALRAGMVLQAKGNRQLISKVDPMAVGGWSDGELRYRDAPLSVVADDLSRIVGAPITIDPQLTGRRVSGVFMTTGDHGRMLNRVGAILGLAVLSNGNGWRIMPLHH